VVIPVSVLCCRRRFDAWNRKCDFGRLQLFMFSAWSVKITFSHYAQFDYLYHVTEETILSFSPPLLGNCQRSL